MRGTLCNCLVWLILAAAPAWAVDFTLVGGSGGISGATGATDNAVLRADGAGGATLQNSLATLSDNGCLTLPGATITANEPLANFTQTWNNAGVTFTGIKQNITSTASGASSLVIDLQVGGSSVFKVDKFGLGTFANNVSGVTFAASSGFAINGDTYWVRDAANTYAQRNGTNAQTLRLYNSYTSGTNYERLGVGWASNVLYVGTEAQTGSNRCSVWHGAAEKALTESSDTAFANVTVATGASVGGRINYTIVADDGSDYQVRSGSIPFALYKSGANAAGAFGTAAEVVSTSAGTLTATWAITGSGTAATLKCNAVSSLTQTTLTIRYRVELFGPSVTVTPQ